MTRLQPVDIGGNSWDDRGSNEKRGAPDYTRSPSSPPLRLSNRRTKMNLTADQSTSVYRYYDLNGLLLYVGITSRGISRNREHNTTKEWWGYVTRQVVDHYATRAEALDVERVLIRSFRPPFNAQHNPSHDQDKRAYLAFAAAGGGTVPYVSFAELFSKQGRKMELRKTSTSGECGVYVSGPESVDIVSRLDATPRKVRAADAGHKGKVRSIEIDSGRVIAVIYGSYALTAKRAMARIGYVSTKPVKLRINSITVDIGSRNGADV